jgi:hypothetical protein
MSNTKTVMSQAANTQGLPLDITDVFSTYLYTGGISGVTNGIDLAGEGGMVWGKSRTGTGYPWIFDTERGHSKWLYTNDNAAEQSGSIGITSFNSDGFNLTGTSTFFNSGTHDYASWTFRKAPKFFDVVTYTGNGVAGRTVSHNLGSVPACMIVKKLDGSAKSWAVYHQDIGNGYQLYLDTTSASVGSSAWNYTDPTDSAFTLGNNALTNTSGNTYVAYLFAHNDGDGGFGPDGDQDIIKCGSFTANSGNEVEIDIGFEPQWILTKSTASSGWFVFDAMRGMSHSSTNTLQANESNAEQALTAGYVKPTATGWIDSWYGNTPEIIYIAIRRGPLAPPESATEVFDATQGVASIPAFDTGFTTDFQIQAANWTTGPTWRVRSRLTNGYMDSTNTNAEATDTSATYQWDLQTGFGQSTNLTNVFSWLWKRAPNFFDVVAYTGNGTAGRTVSHNLGVAPEMMWVKKRNNARDWKVYHSAVGNGIALELNATGTGADSPAFWNDTTPTESVLSLGTSDTVNGSNDTFIAYLFATLAGVSKVFSVTKSSGSDASVDCGFTSGPGFVMLKRTDSTGDWYVWDTERGIVAGNDPYLLLNSTAAEVTSTDYIDPTSNGFTIVNGGLADGDYIGYAVA